MKSFGAQGALVLQLFLALACGQDDLVLPGVDAEGGGACGEWYPQGGKGEGDAGPAAFGMKPEDTFPCLVFESARLGGEDTFINVGDIYLGAKHEETGHRVLVFVIGADNCPACAALIEELSASADALDAAGALMIGAAWCNNIDVSDCDFELDRTELVLKSEGWPTERWLITNDAEGHLRSTFSDIFPTAIVVAVGTMKVKAVENAPSAEDLVALVESL
jgi:hypothetical protein